MFVINYSSTQNIEFANAAGMKKYLDAEEKTWSSFLDLIREDGSFPNIPVSNSSVSAAALAKVFETLKNSLDDNDVFNRLTSRFPSKITLPPPSVELEGQLILGLTENGRSQEAKDCFAWFAYQNLSNSRNVEPRLKEMIDRGTTLITAGYAASALPFNKVSSQKLAGVYRTADANLSALSSEVSKSQEINSAHEEALTTYREHWFVRAKRLENIVVRRERNRRNQYQQWASNIDQKVSSKFEEANFRLDAVDRAESQKQRKRQEEFDRLLDLFHTQLRLRAPVKLWEGRADEHTKKAHTAMYTFFFLITVAIGVGCAVPYFFGDYIAESFTSLVCQPLNSVNCTREFSFKGPLTISGLLLAMSVLLWLTRLQYRVFLSERHLALDASEKKAFAETFLAMKEGEDVGSGNEAIVLASLFRPTQDGIIKDDESALDLSTATILAKQLGRGTS